jgi:hypothetical protein
MAVAVVRQVKDAGAHRAVDQVWSAIRVDGGHNRNGTNPRHPGERGKQVAYWL